MRWCIALGLVLVALLAATAKVAFHGPRRPAHAPDDGREAARADDEAADAETPASPPGPYQEQSAPRPFSHPAPTGIGRRARATVAHLHGLVLPPVGGSAEDAFDGLEVIADDGSRTVTARLSSGGRFSFHLPPGRYTLQAEWGDLVGMTTAVASGDDPDREVAVALGPTATIGGSLNVPDDADVTLLASAVGAARTIGPISIESGKFSIDGLIPGRRYDLIFSGPKIRKTTLRSIAAPTDALEVALATLPIVRGAIGFLDGDSCPIETVSLRGAGLPDDAQTDVGGDCRFELTTPEGASDVTVVAEGPGFYLEESVSIPAQGDPEPICFNPPCPSEATSGVN